MIKRVVLLVSRFLYSLIMKLKHHPLEFFEIYLSISIFIKLLYQLLPVFIRYLFVFIPENVFEFSGGYLTVGVHIEQVEGLLQVLLSHHLVEIRGSGYKLAVFDLTVAVHVNLFHDLLEFSLEEHLFPEELLETFFDLFLVQDAIVVRVELFEDGEEAVLILFGVHAVCNVCQDSLLKLSLAVKVFELSEGTSTQRLDGSWRATP